jgi:hypothetical protein
MQNNLTEELIKYVLPLEVTENFDLVNMSAEEDQLHLYLDEKNKVPEEYCEMDLSPKGFYESSEIKDFPLRDRKVILHIRRRRWVDSAGKSYSRQWELTAEGTRYSKEFAFFLKEAIGYLPDTGPIT